jgi:hypothetical protein
MTPNATHPYGRLQLVETRGQTTCRICFYSMNANHLNLLIIAILNGDCQLFADTIDGFT